MPELNSLALKYIFNTVSASASDANLPSCTISTITQDREGDRVIPEGGDFSNFMKSPVLMWAHGGAERYGAVPIGSVTALEIQPGQGIRAAWKWLENDPFAARIKNAWDQGVVRASSIGFKPIQATPNGQGLDHERWELIELSLCAVPMNPEAVRTLKSLGLLDEPATLYGADGKPIAKAVELGDNDKRSRLEAALQEKYPSNPKVGWNVYLIDVFDAYVIFRDKDGKYQRLDYAMDAAGAVSFTGDPSEVAVQYVPLTQAGKAALAVIEKSGRVLSAVNESRLRAAVTALSDATSVLSEVLAQVMKPSDESPADQEPVKPEDEPLQFVFDDEPTVLRLTLDEDEAFCTIVDDTGHEAKFVIDPSVMRSVIADTVREQLQHAVVEPVGQMMQQALDHARGRVH